MPLMLTKARKIPAEAAWLQQKTPFYVMHDAGPDKTFRQSFPCSLEKQKTNLFLAWHADVRYPGTVLVEVEYRCPCRQPLA